MPSVKAYNARKAQIALLQADLAKERDAHNLIINPLISENNQLRADLASAKEEADAAISTGLGAIKENEALRIQIGVYRTYLRHAYWEDPYVQDLLIPKCLKPMDAIEWAAAQEVAEWQEQGQAPDYLLSHPDVMNGLQKIITIL